MRYLSILAVAAVMGAGQGLAAQQPTTHADSVRARHAMVRHERRVTRTTNRTRMRAEERREHMTTAERREHTRHMANMTTAERREHMRMAKMTASERREHMRHMTAAERREHMRMMERREHMRMVSEPGVLGTAIGPNNYTGVGARGMLQRLPSGLITPDAARTIALRTVPGGTSVDKIRLHSEDGRQVYDVKVITPNRAGNEQVRVDAMTGAVVQTKNVDNPVGTAKSAVNSVVRRVTPHH